MKNLRQEEGTDPFLIPFGQTGERWCSACTLQMSTVPLLNAAGGRTTPSVCTDTRLPSLLANLIGG